MEQHKRSATGDMNIEYQYTKEDVKEIAKESFVKGWHKRVGEDELSDISEQTARSLFDKWWSLNHE